MKKTLLLSTALICMAAAASAQSKSCYVIDSNNQRIRGINLEADSQGNLTLHIDTQVRRTFNRGTYRSAQIPQPKEVDTLKRAFDAKRYDLVIDNAGRLFEQYKYLGWAGYIGYLEGMAYVSTNKFSDGLSVFKKIEQYAGDQIDKVYEGQVRALLGMNKLAEAEKLLDKLANSGDDTTAAFVFNARGKILADQGRDQEAVLQYLKTLLLFPEGKVSDERDEARQKVVALLKKLGEPRAAEFANIK